MATRKVIHLCLSIEGGIRNARSLRGCIEVDGKTLQTTEEVRAFLRKQQDMGRRVLPMSPDCKNFDYQKGCQGCTVEVDP